MITCLITAVIACSFITIGIYTNNFFLMFVGQIFNGFAGSGMVVLKYAYMSEFCSNSHRQIGMMAIMISWYICSDIGHWGMLSFSSSIISYPSGTTL